MEIKDLQYLDYVLRTFRPVNRRERDIVDKGLAIIAAEVNNVNNAVTVCHDCGGLGWYMDKKITRCAACVGTGKV